MAVESGGCLRKRRFPGLEQKATVFQEATRLLDPLPPPQPLTPEPKIPSKPSMKFSKVKKHVGTRKLRVTMKITKKQSLKGIAQSPLDKAMLMYFNHPYNY